MSRVQLSHNLPQLQNLIKRDPESYVADFQEQLRHFHSRLETFSHSPGEYSKELEELVMFLAQVSLCYPEEMSSFPQMLVDLLRTHSTVLDPNMRMTLCRALILLRHKNLLTPSDLMALFFELLKCPDKSLRKFLKDHIVNDIRNCNAKKKDARLNSVLQNFMFKVVDSGEKHSAKIALDVMSELYHRHVWRDAKTVNAVATACFSGNTKIMVTALNFFLGKEDDQEGNDNSDDSDDDLPAVKNVVIANKVNKKTKKRERFLENVKKAHRKKKKETKASSFNFSALHLVHDPQGFAEKLFRKLDTLKEKFEIKLLFLDLVCQIKVFMLNVYLSCFSLTQISRLIGTHELFVLNFYPYVARFLQPHQRDVVRLLQFAAQAAHSLVPPDAIEPVVRAIVDNFVTERNAAEVMAVGLNAVRELCNRCPLALDETLLRDLAGYKTYKDKGVMAAARYVCQIPIVHMACMNMCFTRSLCISKTLLRSLHFC